MTVFISDHIKSCLNLLHSSSFNSMFRYKETANDGKWWTLLTPYILPVWIVSSPESRDFQQYRRSMTAEFQHLPRMIYPKWTAPKLHWEYGSLTSCYPWRAHWPFQCQGQKRPRGYLWFLITSTFHGLVLMQKETPSSRKSGNKACRLVRIDRSLYSCWCQAELTNSDVCESANQNLYSNMRIALASLMN